MKILFIDDEPIRLQSIPRQYRSDCYVAHGMDQLTYYLVHSEIKFDLICCDHDMPLLDGQKVVSLFLKDISIPVVVHSLNHYGALEMYKELDSNCVPCIQIPITQSHWWQKVCTFYADMTGRKL